jgi:DNA mismatch repair protein MutL
MSEIKVLPDHLINQIAAGEVVERPASVVKELLENSLDAGAKKITVEINEGGDSFLRITDDGSGMDKDDALLAYARHATSKITGSEDLFNIHTLGFRGEAIASIASVSYLTIQTKKRGEIEGTLVQAEGGNINLKKSIGCPEGTQIEVRQLFYNTPARKKYLKNASTEYGHVLSTITSMALVNPGVSFKLIHDDKTVFDLPPAEDILIRIRSLLGRDIADNLIPVFYGHSQIKLHGFIGKPSIARASRLSQFLFVNGREVKSHVLSYAVKQSFYSLLPKEKYPVFILLFEIDPKIVDVNVHPRKLEVRFSDEREIFKIVAGACAKALEKNVLAPQIGGASDFDSSYNTARTQQQTLKLEDHEQAAAETGALSGAPVNDYVQTGAWRGEAQGTSILESKAGGDAGRRPSQPSGSVDDALNFTRQIADLSGVHLKSGEENLIPLTQINNSYILCQQGDNLVIVDQHAAHERIRYTNICAEFEQRNKVIQPLLTPLQMEFSLMEINILNDNIDLIRSLGFEVDNFGGNTFMVQAVPGYMSGQDTQRVLRGLIDDLSNQSIKGDYQSRKEKALTYMACRSAVKFGDKLSGEEQRQLMKDLQALDLPYTCPHGRPTMIKMSFEELEKRFGRRK